MHQRAMLEKPKNSRRRRATEKYVVNTEITKVTLKYPEVNKASTDKANGRLPSGIFVPPRSAGRGGGEPGRGGSYERREGR